jgi:poly-gamma-glutamate capsule biosynthesis protein CapA/YwtB (metallophosphatase superfamily)
MNKPASKATGPVRICFIGDVFLGDGKIDLSPEFQELFKQSDLTVANQEGPICHPSPVDSSKILLRCQPGVEQRLADWGVGLVALANNHVCDHGAEGLAETIRRLDEVGVDHLGAGAALDQASQPSIREINGVRIGFLAFAWEGTEARYATQESYGVNPLERDHVVQHIRDLSEQVDHVIVLPHWGYCDYTYPTADSVRLAQAMLDAGATAIVGHHSHIVHGVDQPDERSIVAYSLGNFGFAPYTHGTRTVNCQGEGARGMILQLTVTRDQGLSAQYHFTRQSERCISLDERPRRVTELDRRSQPLVHPIQYALFWKRQVKKRMLRRVRYWMNPLRWRHLSGATVRSLFIMAGQSLRRRG